MKTWILPLIFTLLTPCIGCTSITNEQETAQIKVMTFNIRYNNPADSLNAWCYRSDDVANAILFHDADIVGTQEVLHSQLTDLKNRLSENYSMIGVGRDDGKAAGEYAALWYKSSRFELSDSGHFWLSETPDIAGSIGWDAACVRVATWGIFRDKTSGKELLALNTHLDHVGETARTESVNLILCKIDSISQGRTIIVTGDFNSSPKSNVVTQITDSTNPKGLNDTRLTAEYTHGPQWSYHEFLRLPIEKRTLIDYIFYRGPISVKTYGTLAELNNQGHPLSDHCPVAATMVWKNK